MSAKSGNALKIYLKLLMADKPVSARDLATVCEPPIGPRTVYRIIQELSVSGVPVISKRGGNGGFYIKNEYKRDLQIQIKYACKGKGGD